MKIAVFTDAFFPQQNGVVSHLEHTLPRLAEKHTILVVAPYSRKKIPISFPGNIEIYRMRGLPVFLYPEWKTTLPFSLGLYRKVKSFSPDLVHIHIQWTIGFNGRVIALRLGIPMITTFHGYFMEPEYLKVVHLDALGLHDNKAISAFGWGYARWFSEPAAAVIAPSRFTKYDLLRHGFKNRIEVITHGLPEYPTTLRNIYSVRQPYFLYVGRISREKNLDILINAFEQYVRASGPYHLVIVGDGPYLSELKQIVKQKNLSHAITFLGLIPHHILMSSSIYLNAFAFITASTSETQGISTLEAMSFGLPVIGSDQKATPELIKSCGIICRANSETFFKAMQKLSFDPTLRSSLSRNARTIAKKYSIATTINQIYSLYHDVVSKK